MHAAGHDSEGLMADVLSPRVLLVTSREDAIREMEKIGVSEGGIEAMAGKAQALVVKIANAPCPVAHILKEQMLSLGADAAVSKGVLTHDVDSTDILLFGTPVQLRRLSEKLSYQMFRLPGLGEQIAALLETVSPQRHTVLNAGSHSIDLDDRARVVGILNVTPDSFSQDGFYLRPNAACEHAMKMIEAGADIIDVGGQSSRPGSEPVPEKEELTRVVPVIERLAGEWQGPICVDTYRARVAEEALEAGAAIVNDITALNAEPEIAGVAARFRAALILMHMKGTPATMQHDPSYEDLMGEITSYLHAAVVSAESAGVGADQIAVDPGIGFGKTTEHNLAVLRRLPELAVLGKPILVGPSRKSFIGNVLDLPIDERLEGTLAAAAYAVAQGARIVRVHDVGPVVRAVRLVEACLSARE